MAEQMIGWVAGGGMDGWLNRLTDRWVVDGCVGGWMDERNKRWSERGRDGQID